MTRRTKAFTAWAIDLRLDHRTWPLAGVFWFHRSGPLAPWHDGCRTALFKTRSAARAHAQAYPPRGRVVKVAVAIREMTS